MRVVAMVLAIAVAASGCASNSYKIPANELQRLATLDPETRSQRVRVSQQLDDADVGPAQPVTAETQVVFFPQINVYGPYERRRYYRTNSSWGVGNLKTSGGGGGGGRFNLGGGGGGGGGGGDAAVVVVILVVAAIVLVAVVAVEGSRFDGYAHLHPMHPVYLTGRDGGKVVMPLAWVDPQTAAWTKHAIIRRNEGPWNQLERAPLDREGWNFSMFGGMGTYGAYDGSKKIGWASTIQLGYFPIHQLGFLGSLFLGGRETTAPETLTAFRGTLEVQGYPIHTGTVQFGGYLGWGGAYRSEQLVLDGDVRSHQSDSSRALTGGAMIQIDVNTRIALTARFGLTRAHEDRMTDAMFGLAVY